MSIHENSALEVEIAHMLFVDMVGFTLRPLAGQLQALNQFQRALQQSQAFLRAAEQQSVLCLPTGDGAALAYFYNPVAPLRCALDIARSLAGSSVGLRMGLHSGPVCRVLDVNGRMNVSGEGINTAQRVMDCGDAGHILVSETVAALLLQLDGWERYVRDWGECPIKHGNKVHLYSIDFNGIGNPEPPSRLMQTEVASPARLREQEARSTLPTQLGQGQWVTPEILRMGILPVVGGAGTSFGLLESTETMELADAACTTAAKFLDHLLDFD